MTPLSILSEEIPEDIKRRAYDAALNYRHGIAADPRLKEGPIDPIHNDQYLTECFANAILAERQRDGWRPIETAPKNGRTEILAATRYGVRIIWWGAAAYNRKTKDYDLGWTNGATYGWEPTHWMPLPSVPKGEAA